MAHILWVDFGIPFPDMTLDDAMFWMRAKQAIEVRNNPQKAQTLNLGIGKKNG
jgi:hypothetical protein